MSGGIWINYEFKKQYLDSFKQGLRLHFDKSIPIEEKNKYIFYIKWLRKKYFFPIQCHIYFANVEYFYNKKEKYKSFGVIHYGDDDENNQKLPKIYLPIKKLDEISYREGVYTLNIFLTYYFQWYFYENNKRSTRSLDYEANEYASYVTDMFFNEIIN